jgi:hypothetical protein
VHSSSQSSTIGALPVLYHQEGKWGTPRFNANCDMEPLRGRRRGSAGRATTDAQCVRAGIYARQYKMHRIHCLPRCEGTTIRGERCRMTEQRFCRYHHYHLREATIADNTRRLRAYWDRYRLAAALAKAGSAVGPTDRP